MHMCIINANFLQNFQILFLKISIVICIYNCATVKDAAIKHE